MLQPVGDSLSKEGINRAERGGKDEQGRNVEGQGPLGGYGQSAADGVKGGVGSVAGGVKGAGGYVGGGVWRGEGGGEEVRPGDVWWMGWGGKVEEMMEYDMI